RSRPVAGLADLGLSWEDLVAAEGEDGGGPRGGDLVPLSKVVSAVATVKEPSGRGPLVRAVFGDLGVEHFEQLSRALAAPADPDRDAARRQALQGIGLTPEAVQQKPLESLAKVFLSLAKSPPGGPRRQRAEAFFGAAAPKVGSLARELSMARTLATLEDIEVNRQRLAAGDGLVAFEVILPALRAKLQEKEEPAEREALLAGLFGPRGPELYATATKWPEGIDHSWDFKYEID
ncbi:MAG: hypothetical protein ACKO6B_04255, partial [Planctomycetia bacterium]